MSRANPGTMLLSVMLTLGGLFSITSVLLTEGNSVGQFCQFLLGAGFIFCCIAPRAGFFCWLMFSGYNDLLKRLLVIGGRVSMDDLKFVLGIAPAMFGGVVVALVVGGLMQSRPLTGADWKRLGLGLVCMVVAGVLAAREEGTGINGILQALANTGLYTLLIFVLPALFRGPEVLRIWRFLVLAFLPVAIYGVIQQLVGFADFEVEYLLSGLSLEIKQLVTGEVRAFSTLNSPTALSVVCASLAVVSLTLGFGPRWQNGGQVLSRPLAVLCFLLHTAGLAASTSRTAMLILALVPLGGWCFSSPVRTRAFYGITLGAFVLLVAVSPWLAENLDSINVAVASMGDGGFLSRMIIVGTFWDRLEGFATVLRNPEAWTLFGYGAQEDGEGMYHYHDPVSAILLKYGAVVLVVLLGTIALFMRRFHRQAWGMLSPDRRRFVSHMMALVFALLLVSAVGGNVLTIFPNNIILWAAVSSILVLSARTQSPAGARTGAAPDGASQPAPLPSPPPRHLPIS